MPPWDALVDGKLSHNKLLEMCRAMVRSHLTLALAESILRKLYVDAAMELSGYNACKAARMIGIHRNTLSRIAGKKR